MTRDEIVSEALTWVGTPFVHQQRVKGSGGDCVAMVEGIALKFGVIDKPYRTDYGRDPNMREILQALRDSGCIRLANAYQYRPGDVLFIQYRHEPQHLGIAMPGDKLVHGYSTAGEYVKSHFNSRLLDGLRSTWEWPGVE